MIGRKRHLAWGEWVEAPSLLDRINRIKVVLLSSHCTEWQRAALSRKQIGSSMASSHLHFLYLVFLLLFKYKSKRLKRSLHSTDHSTGCAQISVLCNGGSPTLQGMAFTLEERLQLGIHGLLPPCFLSQDVQVLRVMKSYETRSNPLDKWDRRLRHDSKAADELPLPGCNSLAQGCCGSNILSHLPLLRLYSMCNDNSVSPSGTSCWWRCRTGTKSCSIACWPQTSRSSCPSCTPQPWAWPVSSTAWPSGGPGERQMCTFHFADVALSDFSQSLLMIS